MTKKHDKKTDHDDIEVRPYTERLPVALTLAEQAAAGKTLSAALKVESAHKEVTKTLVAERKAELGKLQEDTRRHNNEVDNAVGLRDVLCEERRNYRTNTKYFVRLDTHEVLREEPLEFLERRERPAKPEGPSDVGDRSALLDEGAVLDDAPAEGIGNLQSLLDGDVIGDDGEAA